MSYDFHLVAHLPGQSVEEACEAALQGRAVLPEPLDLEDLRARLAAVLPPDAEVQVAGGELSVHVPSRRITLELDASRGGELHQPLVADAETWDLALDVIEEVLRGTMLISWDPQEEVAQLPPPAQEQLDAGPPDGFALELLSVATPGAEEFLGRAADVLAARREVAPTVFGEHDPPRTKVDDLAAQWRAEGRRQAGRGSVRLLFDLGAGHGSLSYLEDPWFRFPAGSTSPSRFDLVVESALESGLESALPALLGELAVALDAWYGFLTPRAHARQLVSHRFRRDERHGHPPTTSGPPSWEPGPHNAWELEVRDVSWVQYFGPAFVAQWGEERLAGAGVRSERLATGGYLVWATVDPPPYEPDAPAPESYGWKASVYDALGAEPFARLDQGWPEFGRHVPLMSPPTGVEG